MPKKKAFTRSRSFSTTEMFDEQLKNIMNKKGHLSESETLRYAISELHRIEFPDYIYNRSAKDIENRKKIAAEVEIKQLTPLELAEAEIGDGMHVTDTSGEDWYIIHSFGNTAEPIKLSTLHEEIESIRDIISYHKTTVKKYPVDYFIDNTLLHFWKKDMGLDILTFHTPITNEHIKPKAP